MALTLYTASRLRAVSQGGFDAVHGVKASGSESGVLDAVHGIKASGSESGGL